ncbi:MAG TPA: hypothetical protein VD866_04860 [Urbifossiella sp.]|nr:hypothetical protein [Urbifossiella sp.]
MTAVLLLAACAAATPPPAPAPSPLEFERALDATVPQLRFARYAAKADLSVAVVVVWAGPAAAPAELVLFRPNGPGRLTAVRLTETAAKVVRAATPPPERDPLLDEPAATPLGAWLRDVLDALTAVSPDPGAVGELHVVGDAAGKWAVAASTDPGRGGGHFRTRALPAAVFRVQAGWFDRFLAASADFAAPPAPGTFVYGRRGYLVETTDAIHLRLAAPWDKLPNAAPTATAGGYRTITLAEFAASQRGPFTELLSAPAADALVVTEPRPRLDPLVGLIAAE